MGWYPRVSTRGHLGPSSLATPPDMTQLLSPHSRDLLTPSLLSRSVHCPNLPCCAGEGLPGCLLQLHLPVHWGAVPHSDPVSGSLMGGAWGQDIPPHTGQTQSTVQYAPAQGPLPAPNSERSISAAQYTPRLPTNLLPDIRGRFEPPTGTGLEAKKTHLRGS